MAEKNLPQITKETQTAALLGEQLIQAGPCAYPPHVQSDDLLLVDFDQAAPDVDGLYIMQTIGDDGQIAWVGCRRVEFSLIHGALADFDGKGDMRPLADAKASIIGKVRRVYRAVIGG